MKGNRNKTFPLVSSFFALSRFLLHFDLHVVLLVLFPNSSVGTYETPPPTHGLFFLSFACYDSLQDFIKKEDYPSLLRKDQELHPKNTPPCNSPHPPNYPTHPNVDYPPSNHHHFQTILIGSLPLFLLIRWMLGSITYCSSRQWIRMVFSSLVAFDGLLN